MAEGHAPCLAAKWVTMGTMGVWPVNGSSIAGRQARAGGRRSNFRGRLFLRSPSPRRAVCFLRLFRPHSDDHDYEIECRSRLLW